MNDIEDDYVISSTLETEIQFACQLINEVRDQKIAAGVLFDGNMYDSDATSVRRVTGAVILAGNALAAGSSFEIQWVTKDNSVVNLDAPKVLALGKALADQETTLVFKANSLKGRIRQCTTIPDVWRVQWE